MLYNVVDTQTNYLKRKKGRKNNLPTMTGIKPPNSHHNSTFTLQELLSAYNHIIKF